MMPFMNWKKQSERELLNKNTAKDINKDIQQSAQAMKPKNILIPKKIPSITQKNIFDINKRNFIKKGILGLIAGIGIAAFSKTAQAWGGFIKFPGGTEQSAAYTDANAVSAVEAAGLALASGKNIKVIQALDTDHTYSGLAASMIAGTSLSLPLAVHVGSDGKMELAKADSATTMPCVALVAASIAENAVGEFLMQGFMRDNAWNWTPGGLLYIHPANAGNLTQTLPSTTGHQVQVIGVAITADIIYFNPSPVLVEIS